MSALGQFAKRVSALDFADENAELASLKATRADLEGKREAVRKEIGRLNDEIANYAAIDPAKVAEAIMAGVDPAEAAAGGVSREDLEKRRDALASSLEPLRDKIEQLAAQAGEVQTRMTGSIAEAAAPYLAELRARQVRAAEEIVEAEAAMLAIGAVSKRRPDGDEAARRARDGVTGPGSLLGVRDVLSVPSDLLAALRPLKGACGAVPAVPDRITVRARIG